MKNWISELIQLVGVLLLGWGIGYELIMKAHIGLIFITVGSIVFAIGTKLKHTKRS